MVNAFQSEIHYSPECDVRDLGRTVTTVWMDLPLPSSGVKKTLQMETAGSSYMSDDLCHQSTRRHIQEESIFHSYARENLKILKGIVCYPDVTLQ
jgi:hypothetical protein